MAALFSTSYLPTVSYFAAAVKHGNIIIEASEHFIKQTYRNRCYIYGANGVLMLVIPLENWRSRQTTKDIKISYHNNWQKIHWKSLEAAYRTSPYFEFYCDHFEPFYCKKKEKFLIDLNDRIFDLINQLLELDIITTHSSEYRANPDDFTDLRNAFHPKRTALHSDKSLTYPAYHQVFHEKHGFIPDLSIADLLFNLGPKAKDYLALLNQSFTWPLSDKIA